jgi:conjugative relaxase-like TrwC/TraI family protein
MAGVTRLAVGHDASYPFKQMGELEKPLPVDYYLGAVEKGEPPGIWTGAGVSALGFDAGAIVDREAFELLYGEFVNPETGEQLGRKPQEFKRTADVVYEELVKAEPEATAKRRLQLRQRAEKETRQPVHYWDATFSPSKTITAVWAAFRAAAKSAEVAGDAQVAAEWSEAAEQVWAAVMKGSRRMLSQFEQGAGVTRAGHHGGKRTVSGREAGRWEDAREFVAASFAQHTSRDGDPQLHVHNLILHVVRRESDGQWRRLDGESLTRLRREANAAGVAVMEEELSRTLGLRWVPGQHGRGLEIAGVPQEVIDLFSSRRDSITALQQQLAEQYRLTYGRDPDARTLEKMRQAANFTTRNGKEEEALDLAKALGDWERQMQDAGLGTLTDLAYSVVAVSDEMRQQEQAEAGARDAVIDQLAQEIQDQLAVSLGREADENETASIARFASFVTRGGTEPGPFDPAALLHGWHAQQEADALRERDIRRDTNRAEAAQHAAAARAGNAEAQERKIFPAYPAPRLAMTREQEQRVMAEALAAVQESRSGWRRADLAGYIQERFPAGAYASDELVARLTDEALIGRGGEYVALLSAPEWPRVPEGLRRANGDSVFRPPNAELYAAQSQITLEERLMSDAQAPNAPRLDPDIAALMLGADRSELEARLRSQTVEGGATGESTGSGLRLDQAAAAWYLLTSPRRAEVMTGPAGSGKTRTSTVMARAWQEAGMGPVVALTTSSNARNVIRREAEAAGIGMTAYNTAEWLGHTREGRETRPPVEMVPGTLLILDEAAMMSVQDMASIMRRAAAHGAKVVLTGDEMQLQAVEGAGGMAMMARQMGHVLLGEVLRFSEPWEGSASLRVRAGDTTVLQEYAEHGRLYGGSPEQMTEAAARAWLTDYLNGGDPILMAATEERAADLSRRIRDDLIHWGIVDGQGGSIDLRNGHRASRGDLIMARRNDKHAIRSDPAGQITNRDVLLLTDPGPGGTGIWVEVRRLVSYDPATGQRKWSEPFRLSRAYLRNDAHLGYAVTIHSGQAQTRGTGYAVFTGEEDRQALYPALTRGANGNYGFFFTADPRAADPQSGTRPAAELARQRMLDRERKGMPVRQPELGVEELTAAGVAARIMERDGQELSATELRAAELADIDRLDLLYSQWETVTRDAAQREFESAVKRVLSAHDAKRVREDRAAAALWRGLREANAAGLAPEEALSRALAWGPLDTAVSVAKTMEWRIRKLTAGREPLPRPWTEQVPQTGGEDTDRFVRELAEAMEDRQRRLGEYTAETLPLWARQGLGHVPAEPLARLEWEQRAAVVTAYREMWGYSHPGDPIGPRPSEHTPDARAMWQAAADALTRRDGIDLSPLSDGQLWSRRAAFEREMAWAPPYPAAELESARKAERDSRTAASRADMEASVAGDDHLRDIHENLAAAHRLLEAQSREYADRLAQVADTYAEWEAVTESTRRYALAADAELRRRHPELQIKPLTAESAPGEKPGTGTVWTQPDLNGTLHLPDREPDRDETPVPADGAPGHAGAGPTVRERVTVTRDEVWIEAPLEGFPPMPALPDSMADVRPGLVADYEHRAELAQQKIAELFSMEIPSEDPEAPAEPAWQQEIQREREAVLQPPQPLVAQPAAQSTYYAHPYYQHPQPGQDEPVMHGAPDGPDVQADLPDGPET